MPGERTWIRPSSGSPTGNGQADRSATQQAAARMAAAVPRFCRSRFISQARTAAGPSVLLLSANAFIGSAVACLGPKAKAAAEDPQRRSRVPFPREPEYLVPIFRSGIRNHDGVDRTGAPLLWHLACQHFSRVVFFDAIKVLVLKHDPETVS